MSNQESRFSVIMPAYNEGRYLAQNIQQTCEVMESLNETYEVVVVDDGSRDNTATIINEVAQGNDKIKPVVLTGNSGKGFALREGFQKTKGELIFFLDADLDLDPKQFNVLYDIYRKEQVQVVVGSKRHPQSKLNYPRRRRIVSAVYFFLVKLLFGLPIRDTQTGIKLFQRQVLEKIFPKIVVKKYAFDLELLVLAHHYGYRIAEAPVVVNYTSKFGHIGLNAIFKTWWDTMAIWYRLYIKKYYRNK
ncbi:glycosyltransferase [bacterium]|nr:glycosyltransferase [bacterium]